MTYKTNMTSSTFDSFDSAEIPLLELLTDTPRTAVHSSHPATLHKSLPQALTAQLQELAERVGVPLERLFWVAFQTLLHRYTGQDDAAATIPLQSVALHHVFWALSAWEEETTFLDALQKETHAAEADHVPLQVVFSYGAAAEARELALSLVQTEEGLVEIWRYESELFAVSTIERMTAHWETLLGSIVADPEQPIRKLNLMTEQERQQLLVEWNRTAAEYGDKTLYQLFEEWAATTPDAVAVAFAGESLTYGELNARANRLAHFLQKNGVGPDVLVGLCVDRSPELLVGLLGIVKAGGAYVPLDPANPSDRMRVIMDDAQIRLLLTQEHLLERLPEQRPQTYLLDRDFASLAQESAENLPNQVTLDSLFYVIYTSGTTGIPKGVACLHRGALNLIVDFHRKIPVPAESAYAMFTSIGFDVSVLEIFSALSSGGRLHLVPEQVRAESEAFFQWLVQEEVHASFVPAFMIQDLAARLRAGCELPLKRMLTGVEPIPEPLLAEIAGRLGISILNGYGPTETSICSTSYMVHADVDVNDEPPHNRITPIGRPVQNTTHYVLDRSLQPVPIGVPGELYIGGHGVTRGYWNRPELTAERFIENPFSERPYEQDRLYRTGDLVRYLPDGNLEFLGRIDQQVKMRGFRIELGEIEATLQEYPAVKRSLVVPHEFAPGDKRLVAYIVPNMEYVNAAQQTAQWETTFEQAYAEPAGAEDVTFNISGWNSSYTGEPIPAAEMQEWLEHTVERIRALQPKRVLEIGCGSGMILYRVAPDCERYVGCDFSQSAVQALKRQLEQQVSLPQVEVLHRPANDFSGFAPQSFSCVVINSVLQYFPSIDYLLHVLQQAVTVLEPGGRLFVGDVRSLPLLSTFHTALELHQATPTKPVDRLLQHIERRGMNENELVVDPAFFLALQNVLPQIGHVEILPKRGRAENELTKFRYDVVLHIGAKPEQEAVAEWVDWQEQGFSLQMLRQLLSEHAEKGDENLYLRNVPNCLVVREVRACELLRSLRTSRAEKPEQVGDLLAMLALPEATSWEQERSATPEDVLLLGESLGYDVQLSLANTDASGCFAVAFLKKGVASASRPVAFYDPQAVELQPWHAYANNPMQAAFWRLLVPELRFAIKQKLPEYMMPASFLLIHRIPLNTNGKVDRRALPTPVLNNGLFDADYVASRNPVEELLADVYAEVLGVETVGTLDDFFALGGHSLLATQVVSRIREAFGVDLPVRSLFDASTVRSLAERVQAEMGKTSAGEELPILPIDRETVSEFPLSFAQQRLWFLDQFLTNRAAYNIPILLRLQGVLDVAVLERSLQEIIRRHEVLRTTIGGGEPPVQRVVPDVNLPLPLFDLTAEPEDTRLQLLNAESKRPFDLEKGPLLRACLVRLGEQEHELLLGIHHIAFDGWSMGVLTEELAALYGAYLQGKTSPLPDMQLQYADYAVWQQNRLSGDVLANQLAYWKQKLAGELPMLQLPTDRPRPAVRSFRGAVLRCELPARLTDGLKALARRSGVTLYMTLLAAFQTLLYRYTGQEDLLVGSPIAGRNRAEIEGMIGFFVNTLVLRTDLSGAPTFRELLGRVRDVTLDAYAHQDVPFEKLVEELAPTRDLSDSPLFQAMFVLQNNAELARELPGLHLRASRLHPGASMFELTLEMEEANGTLEARWEYSTDLFDEAAVARMMSHLETLLSAVVSAPDVRLQEISLLPERERQTLLGEWSGSSDASWHGQLFTQEFEAQAVRTPNAIAVTHNGHEMSYAELNAAANRLARHLLLQGVQKEQLVGVSLPRSAEQIVALLAIWKAGAAYVPLDPTYPQERLAYLIADAQMALILTREQVGAMLPATSARLLCLDREEAMIAAQGSENVHLPLTPEHLAYVIYTSGSTGRPKGVLIEHRGICNMIRETICGYDVRPDSRVLAFASFNFDASLNEIGTALLAGATLVLADADDLLPGPSLIRLLHTQRITNITLPPSALALLAAEDFPHLRCVVSAGEECSAEVAAQWSVGRRFVNAYGPTEATVCVSYAVWTEGVDGEGMQPMQLLQHLQRPSIGRPLANVETYVLDARLQPVPIGVPGELYIGGLGVARGYLNRPEQTEEAFVAHPFAAQSGARLYKSGDLVRYRADGSLEYLGRVDDQVKIRGFRVELGEIESALQRHAHVRQTVVVARADIAEEKRLVAYVVPDELAPEALSISEMRRHLRATLPSYMIPAHFVTLPSLPLTPNGKVDHAALPAPSLTRADAAPDNERIAPRNEVEAQIAALFEKVLKLQGISIHDNFFELGGHSLLATRVISRLRDAFGVELSVRALFEAPTVALLSERVQIGQKGHNVTLHPTPHRVSRDGSLPLSFAQQRLWFMNEWETQSGLYNMPVVLRLTGPLDPAALEAAVNELVCRHEILRTTFAEEAGEVCQQIAPFWQMELQVVDLSPTDEETAWVREEVERPFDLEKGPLLRVSLLRLAEGESAEPIHLLIVNMHHIISDAWSLGVFTEELTALYNAFANGQPFPLAPLPLQYADFAVWQRDWLSADVLDEQLAYWKRQLAGELPVNALPTDRPRPAVQTYNGAVQWQTIPSPLTDRLQALCTSEGVTLYMTLLAAFQALLHRYSGQDDILVGTPVANRSRSEWERMIGFFINMLVLRTDLSGDLTFRELLQRVRDVALGAFAHQEVPFEKVVEELQPERDPSYSPLFQVMFALQNATFSWELNGLQIRQEDVDASLAKYDLTLSAEETGEGLTVRWEYNTDLFDRETIARMMAHFATLLDGIVTQPDAKVWALPLLTNLERQQLLAEEAGGTENPLNLIPTALAEQAHKTPDSVALMQGDQQMTYGELHRRATLLAQSLREQGIGAEDLVGVCLARSFDLVVAILGVMHAGAVFVPLDPSYPQERLQAMIEDAELAVILTDAAGNKALPPHEARLLNIATDWEEIERNGQHWNRQQEPNDKATFSVSHRPTDLAYMIYTSGSTGRPKAVMVEHGNLAATLIASQESFGFANDDVVPWIASEAFDIAYFELLNTLISGGTAVIFTREQVLDLPQFVQDLAACTMLHGVPSLMRQLVQTIREQKGPARHFARLRKLFTGGDAVPTDLMQELVETFPQADVHVLYGPTEGTIICSQHLVQPSEMQIGHPIGRPLGNANLRIYDAHQQLVPLGVPGELYIGGASVARGYYRRPDLTADKFVLRDGTRWYRTGDLVRRTSNGGLEFLGRIDNQVKIRGFRIELGEVEAVLLQHPSVRECVVIVREETPGDKRLIAYVVTHPDHTPSNGELQAFLQAKLPNFMVPSAFIRLESLPLNANQKVDRKALPAPKDALQASDARYVAPRTETEARLAAILQQLLGVQRVGVEDNFFAIGGHSLLATQVISRIVDAFGIKVPVRAFFEAPTVAALAAFLQNEMATQTNRSENDALPLTPIPRPSEGTLQLPASFAQQRLWFADRLESNSAMYNMIEVVRLNGPLQIAALQQSLDEIVRRHEALRTAFTEVDGVPMQVIRLHTPLVMPLIDLQMYAAPQREEEAMRIAEAEAQEPFDLQKDLLFRTRLLKLGEEQHLLLVSTHHIVNDGWSTGVFYRELKTLYSAYSTGTAPVLPELAIQYADFAVWQRNWLQGKVLETQLAYWRQHLGGELPVLQLPSDRPRPNKAVCRGEILPIRIPPEVATALKQLSQRTGVSLYMTMLAAFNTLMYRYSGAEDFLVGAPIAGRNRREIEGLIGFFVNLLTLRIDLAGNPTFLELIDRVRDVTLGAYAHQDLPFEKVVEELQPDRDLSQSPLFNTVFVLQNAPRELWELNGLSLEALPVGNGTAIFDLTLQLFEEGEALNGEFVYNAEMFDRSTIERMNAHFQNVLLGLVADPMQRIADVPILSEQERHQLLVEWNDTATADPEDRLAHEWFEIQAAKTPGYTAAVYYEQRLTYAELNERANRLAHHLQKRGVTSDVLVGICLDRSIEMVVAMLAVMKAGGGYLPMDPNYPPDRLAFMVEDAEIALVLTIEPLLTRMPPHNAPMILLDRDWEGIATESADNPTCAATPDSACYVVYTSGSTGRPKGVVCTHRGLSNLIPSMIDVFALEEKARLLQFATFSFDAATHNIMTTLCAGGEVYLARYEEVMPGPSLIRLLRDNRITHVLLPPSVLALLPEDEFPDLRSVITGTEPVSTELVTRWVKGRRFVNAYGPTETTVISSNMIYTEDSPTYRSMIGRPVGNTQMYILDAHRQPVPIGVPGELYIGGRGVARGYLNRPELTAEKFVPNPFHSDPSDILYRTGDLVRYLPDGTLDILGRIDQQVKIRGFRIELGEIEAVLLDHEAVRNAVVTVREDEPGNKRLVAYVVPDYQAMQALEQEADETWQAEQVSQWESLFDDVYEVEVEDDTFNTAGWDSHYTGEPIPSPEMREWLDHTMARIRRQNGTRVLEIGCGTGMILFDLLPDVEHYTGMDIAGGVLQKLHRQLAKRPSDLAKVKLLHQTADQLASLTEEDYDLVILNSVVQYFPSVDYLLQVLEGAVRLLGNGGVIFLGDVRSLPLLETFHTAVELYRAADDWTTERLHQQIQSRLAREKELLLDPAFFSLLQQRLPQIGRVDVQLKKGQGRNELTQFRYDVVLHIDGDGLKKPSQKATHPTPQKLDWQQDELSLVSVRTLLAKQTPAWLVLTDVPDARIFHASYAKELLALPERPKTVGELRRMLDAVPAGVPVEPDDLFAIEQELPYEVTIRPANPKGTFDVLFRHRTLTGARAGEEASSILQPVLPSQDLSDYASNPLRSKFADNLVPLYRSFVADRLPDYMVPSAFVILDFLPLNPNGKVDRKALPSPDNNRAASAAAYIAPRNDVEELVADIWQQVLGVEQVGVHDNFFELGGHSLIMTQVASRLRDALEIDLPLQKLFEAATVAQIATVIEDLLMAEFDALSDEEKAALLESEDQ